MEKPNFDTQEYRDNLAKDLKDIRKTSPQAARDILREEQDTTRYNLSKLERHPLTQSAEDSIKKQASDYLAKLEFNPYLDEIEKRKAGHLIDLIVEAEKEFLRYIPDSTTYTTGKSSVSGHHFLPMAIMEELGIDLSDIKNNSGSYKFKFTGNAENFSLDSAYTYITQLEETQKSAFSDIYNQSKLEGFVFDIQDSEKEYLTNHKEILESINDDYVNNFDFKLEDISGAEEIHRIYPNEFQYHREEIDKQKRLELLKKLASGHLMNKSDEVRRVLSEISSEFAKHIQIGAKQDIQHESFYTNDVNLYVKTLYRESSVFEMEELENDIKSLFRYSWAPNYRSGYDGNQFSNDIRWSKPLFNDLGVSKRIEDKEKLNALFNTEINQDINEIVDQNGGLEKIFTLLGNDAIKLCSIENSEFSTKLREFLSGKKGETFAKMKALIFYKSLEKPDEDIDFDFLNKQNVFIPFLFDPHIARKDLISKEREVLEKLINKNMVSS